ncbi:MAG TPA: hypothetical protein VHL61_09980 [Luteimonas sp.]|jgi:hypothetical protein|nr:hypothetical protein [Luteimonas sp.]
MRKTMIAAVVLGLCSVGAWAQNVRPPVTPQPARVTPQLANALVIDYQAQYRKEVEKNKQLRGENDGLRQQLAEMTRHGGSLVHAYCETRTVSRNTAGDRNDCARNGYTCEAVSGLCRTSANDSDQCSDGFLLDVDHCVPQPTHD